MKYVLDTTAASLLMRGEPAAISRLAEESRTDVLLPQPAVAEIEYGISRLRASKKRRSLEEALADLLAVIRRAEWTDAVSERFGDVKAKLERRGNRLEDFDIAIAAHALAHEATLVTSNIRHMKRVPGLLLEDWGAA